MPAPFTVCSAVQSVKAERPMAVAVSGNVTERRNVFPLKARAPIPRTGIPRMVSGITISVSVPKYAVTLPFLSISYFASSLFCARVYCFVTTALGSFPLAMATAVTFVSVEMVKGALYTVPLLKPICGSASLLFRIYRIVASFSGQERRREKDSENTPSSALNTGSAVCGCICKMYFKYSIPLPNSFFSAFCGICIAYSLSMASASAAVFCGKAERTTESPAETSGAAIDVPLISV